MTYEIARNAVFDSVEALMESAKVSVPEFARMVGVSNVGAYAWKHKKNMPSRKSEQRIVERFRRELPVETTRFETAIAAVKELNRQEREDTIDRLPSQSLRSRFEGRSPYCKLGKASDEVGIFDYGLSKEGFGIVLAAWLHPENGKPTFRRTPARQNGNGLYIAKGGIQFYFTDDIFMTRGFSRFLAGIEEV